MHEVFKLFCLFLVLNIKGNIIGKMMLLLLVIVAQVMSERIHVVTPENEHAGVVKEVSSGGNATLDENDSYLKAYRELHNTAERRNPLGSYADNHHYNTLVHSSYVDEDVYPEFSYKTYPHKYHRYHPVPSVMYGPPSPVSYYHHHHHQEEIPSHHTVIGFPVASPFHFLSSFLAKFGLQKIMKLIAKIAVLKIILKFVAIVALFFVLPTLLPREKDKGETEDDRLLDSLNEVTDWVWNGIEEKKKMDEEEEEEEEEDEEEEEEQQQQHGEGGENNLNESDNDKNKDKDEEELDGTDLKLLNKIIKEWKEENFGGPDKGSAVSFLFHCVTVVNRVLGIMLGFVKMKHKNMDVLDAMMFDRFSLYMKDLAKMWPKIKSGFTG